MSPKLDRLLCKRYPKIFRDRHKSPKVTCMCWGFPGDGWFMLIDKLCAAIQRRIDWSRETVKWHRQLHRKYMKEHGKAYASEWSPWIGNLDPIPQVVADQVKEKFGGLRFYYHGGDDTIDGMVRLAEDASNAICEECGAFNPAVGRTKQWIHTTCQPCLKKSDRPDREWAVPKENREIARASKRK